MFRPRIIPCLLLKGDGLVKTVQFDQPVYVGDPINAVKIFNDAKSDELIFLDIEATKEGRIPSVEVIQRISDEAYMPFAVGGGIQSLTDVETMFEAGAEKIVINSAAYTNPNLITQAAEVFGSQAIVISVDAKKSAIGYELFSAGGTIKQSVDLLEHVKKMEELGAGELFINSIDQDGKLEGYDLDLIKLVSDAVNIPVIACGGASKLTDFSKAVNEGNASAAAAGSLFVFLGINRAVLINYPEQKELFRLFNPDYEQVLEKKVADKTNQAVNPTNPTKVVIQNKDYKICARCVMDSTAGFLILDEKGHCNYCNALMETLQKATKQEGRNDQAIEQMVNEIKVAAKGKKYDCVIGVSGGVDSTYLAYITVKEFGLNPIVVHLDNGWNSKLSVKNIHNIITKLDIDLYTHVIDWEEFKSLQKAYIQAGVLDIEALTDHAITAILFEVADKYDIKHILLGMNNKTETIMPKNWTFNKNDDQNIRDINKKHGTKSIKTFPTAGFWKLQYYKKVKGIKLVSPLEYVDYNDSKAKELIMKELNWQDYGGKHYESIFTRFYQGYLLPRKFNIDKRRAHYSSLVCLGELSREAALAKLSQPTYRAEMIETDYDYTVKKFDYTKAEFEQILNTPPKSHFAYKTNLYSKFLKQFMVPTNPIAQFLKRITGGSKLRV